VLAAEEEDVIVVGDNPVHKAILIHPGTLGLRLQWNRYDYTVHMLGTIIPGGKGGEGGGGGDKASDF